MDMARTGQIAQAVSDAVARFGRLDILVNNAGIAPDNLAEKVREDDFDLTVAINLKGTFFASQAAARVMIAQKSGLPLGTVKSRLRLAMGRLRRELAGS